MKSISLEDFGSAPRRAGREPLLPAEALEAWQAVFGDRLLIAPFAAVYPRVSSNRQENGYSLISQLKAELAYALTHGFSVRPEHIYWEVHTGDGLWARPALSRLRIATKASEFEAAIFYSVDRFARKALYVELMLDEVTRAGVSVSFVTQSFDATPDGALLRSKAGYAAEWELNSLRERVNRGRRERIASGKPLGVGKAPYGMRYVDGPHEKRDRRHKLAADPATAPVLQWIFREVESGRTLRAICADLNREGIPPPCALQAMKATGRPRVWTNATLNVLLENPAYKGEGWANRRRQFKTEDGKRRQVFRPCEEWIKLPQGTYPRLVADATWNAAQQLRAQKRAYSSRSSSTPEAFLLRAGFVRCAVCGWSMSTIRAGRCSRSRYFCIAKAHGREVPADVRDDRALPPVSIPSEALDDAVWEHVSLILNRPEYVQQMIARLEADDRTDLDLAALVACGTKVRIELENYAMAISAASSPPVVATLTAKMYELDSTLDEIEREHDRISQERAKVRAHIGELKAVYADAGRTRSQMTYEMRRRTLTSLGLQVYVEPRCTRRSHAMPRYRIEMALIDVAAEMTNDGRSVSLTQLSIDEPLSVTFAV